MKVIKDDIHSLLLNVFGHEGKHYLTISTLLFFDLQASEGAGGLLKEKELWQCAAKVLGEGKALDQGMPKTSAEVLVAGDCCTPGGQPLRSAEVEVRVGTVQKRLAVFGERYWIPQAEHYTMSEPVPFAQMPIVWERAFGGPNFPANPLGKGAEPALDASGQSYRPLPNIEDPRRLISAVSDAREPAGFGPYDLTWPQRQTKVGTYDAAWLKERWPFFPQDFDWSFFNTAPPDQWLRTPTDKPFFRGDEDIEIRLMHPELPRIATRLPGFRARAFVTAFDDWRQPDPEKVSFREIEQKLDTVLLFPTALRGVAIWRGSAQVADDEYQDLHRIMLVTEPLRQAPRPLEDYYAEQKKRLSRTVNIDLAPIEKAKRKIAEALNAVAAIPKRVEEAKALALGKAPAPRRTIEQQSQIAVNSLNQRLATIEKGQERLAKARDKWGHLAKFDPNALEPAKQEILAAIQTFQAFPAAFEEAMAPAKDAEKDADAATAALKTRQAARPNVYQLPPDAPDPAEAFKPPASLRLQQGAMRFVTRCNDLLFQDAEAMKALHGYGLTDETIRKAFLGYNPYEMHIDPKEYALRFVPADPRKGLNPFILIPGFVIPIFSEAIMMGMTIRPKDFRDPSGQSRRPLKHFPAAYLAPGTEKPIAIVADYLDGLLLAQEVGSFCTVAIMTDIAENPALALFEAAKDPIYGPHFQANAALLEAAPTIVYVAAADSPPGDPRAAAFAAAFPKIIQHRLPTGTTVIDARQSGVDLRRWLLQALPNLDVPEPLEYVSKDGPFAFTIPKLDIKGMIDGIAADLAKVTSKYDALLAETKVQALALAGPALVKQGLDPEQALFGTPAAAPKGNPFVANPYAEHFDGVRGRLAKHNMLTSERAASIDKAEHSAQKILSDAAANYDQGTARIAAAKEAAKDPLPAWAKEKLGGLGADLPGLPKLTREDVVAGHAAGLSFAGKNLAGLDLSKLDLRGLDLERAILKKTNFTGTVLDEANLKQCIGPDINLTAASLQKACLDKAILPNALCAGANLAGARLGRTILTKADCSGTLFHAAQLDKTIFEGAIFAGAQFKDARGRMVVFLNVNAAKADFRGVTLEKSIFTNATLDNADFSASELLHTLFLQSSGQAVSFAGARFDGSRIILKSAFPGADFRGLRAVKATFMESDLSGADFSGAVIERSLLEKCDFTSANFQRASLKRCRFNKSILHRADMKAANLFQGSLRKARLAEADFTGANLYAVDFYHAAVRATRFEQANVKSSLLEKRIGLIDDAR